MRMFRRALVAALCLATSQEESWEKPSDNFDWSFPRDHWAHETFRTEWWYVTGFLESDTRPAREFAYQFTFFRIGATPRPRSPESAWDANSIVMGHAAITDLDSGERHFAEVLYRGAPLLAGFGAFPDTTLAWSRSAPGSSGEWRLTTDGTSFRASMADDNLPIGMTLHLQPTKPLAFQGPNGFSKKNTAGTAASMYYTMSRMHVTGSIMTDGIREQVTGTGWMDREFSSGTLSDRQVGWDWFGVQLADRRDVMAYVLRDSTGARDFGHVTLIDERGQPTYLEAGGWTLQSMGTWTSEATGITYPMRWRLTIPSANIDVELIPFTEQQENVSELVPRLNYWEGAVAVLDRAGTRIGRGFAELTGYGGSRPAI